MTRLRIRKKLRKACTKAKYTTLKALTWKHTSSGKLIAQVSTPVIAVTAVIGVGFRVHAYQIYTGGERGRGEPDYPRLTSTPNADTTRDEFLANLDSYGTETFEGFAPQTTQPLTLSFSGVGTAIFQGRGTVRNLPTGTSNIIRGTYPISGNQYLEAHVSTGPLSDPKTFFSSITFSQPVAALGFYATAVSDYFINPPVSLELTRVNGSTQRLPIPSFGLPFDVTVQYYGIIAQDPSEEFIKVRFQPQSSRSDAFGLDDVTVAKLNQVKSSKPVPEPATILGVLAASGFGVALRRKFKQHKQTA
ncbi:PEP-CTERM sorting domain-containing protein [Brasilonema sp. UFV-L1]|uniref:PEP-CTERM sorting domain-containing protein n=1 Tax=Brasilonema sp. UFV-L1 TaxID=2234130 RepID=UPI00145DD334|nr:PEP-CTERM sorting domain-containing protein [Brasilonema sp. UFV-L1]NMG11207.1 hypothetical protein [Brasilonema sp. UFV-L1]